MTDNVNALSGCWRCHKPIKIYAQYVSVDYPVNGRGQSRQTRAYHLKCLPPHLFHQTAGSRPAGRVAPD